MRVAPGLMLLLLSLAGCTAEDGPPMASDGATGEDERHESPGGRSSGTSSQASSDASHPVARDFHVLTIVGDLHQVPAYSGTQFAACGRPAGAFSGLDYDERSLHVVRNRTDFDRERSWLAVGIDVQVVDDSSSCDLAFLSAHEGPYAWTLRSTAVAVAPADGGLTVGDEVLQEGESRVVHVDEPFGSDHRHVGDVIFHYRGAWNTTDLVESSSESATGGDFRGFWLD